MLKVYFETQAQSQLFLLLCAFGFGCAALVEFSRLLHAYGPVWDVLLTLLLSAMLLGLLFFTRIAALRGFYLLAILTGMMLYCFGIRKILQWTGKKIGSLFKKGRRKAASVEFKSEI